MSNRIQSLPPRLANQIAAGEVIERPASVLKELLENAIDAGATKINIEIEKGGKQLIKVHDNGSGIHKDDLVLALTSHATSKIKTVSDLAAIGSLGFRGEALASISSVSRLVLTSKQKQQQQALSAQAQGREMQVEVKPAAHTDGTTVEVRDLFFNTPARRKFLRTDKTEFSHIEEVLKSIALSHFNVAFDLKHNDKIVKQLAIATTDSGKTRRIQQLCGKSFIDNALYLEMKASDLAISGWLGMPDIARNQADLQYFYVNGRMVRDRLVNHAIKQAFSDKLYPGKQPCFILFLEVAPSTVDVNVHPTKHEVRFQESRLVHDFIAHAIEDALNDGVPSETKEYVVENKLQPHMPEQHEVNEDGAIYDDLNDSTKMEVCTDKKPLSILRNEYLLIETETALQIIRILDAESFHYEKCLNEDDGCWASQPLLFPTNVKLDESVVNSIEKVKEILEPKGWQLDLMDDVTIVIRAVPHVLQGADMTSLLLELMACIQISEQKPAELFKNEIACLHAQYIALERAQNYTMAMAEQLLKHMASWPLEECHHVICELSYDELEKLFS